MIKKYLEIFKKSFYLFALIDVGILVASGLLVTKFGFTTFLFIGIAFCLSAVCLIMMLIHKLMGVPNPFLFENKRKRDRRKKYENERIESALELSAIFLPVSALCLALGVVSLFV